MNSSRSLLFKSFKNAKELIELFSVLSVLFIRRSLNQLRKLSYKHKKKKKPILATFLLPRFHRKPPKLKFQKWNFFTEMFLWLVVSTKWSPTEYILKDFNYRKISTNRWKSKLMLDIRWKAMVNKHSWIGVMHGLLWVWRSFQWLYSNMAKMRLIHSCIQLTLTYGAASLKLPEEHKEKGQKSSVFRGSCQYRKENFADICWL